MLSPLSDGCHKMQEWKAIQASASSLRRSIGWKMSTTAGDEDGSGDQQRREAGDAGLRCTRENARRADLVRTNPQGACGRVPPLQLRERRTGGREETGVPRYAAVP